MADKNVSWSPRRTYVLGREDHPVGGCSVDSGSGRTAREIHVGGRLCSVDTSSVGGRLEDLGNSKSTIAVFGFFGCSRQLQLHSSSAAIAIERTVTVLRIARDQTIKIVIKCNFGSGLFNNINPLDVRTEDQHNHTVFPCDSTDRTPERRLGRVANKNPSGFRAPRQSLYPPSGEAVHLLEQFCKNGFR